MDEFKKYRRGDIIWINNKTSDNAQHVQKGDRPVVIIQNNQGNLASPTLIVASLTGRIKKLHLPTHVYLEDRVLDKPSVAMLEQIMTIDKIDVFKHKGRLSRDNIKKIDYALNISVNPDYCYSNIVERLKSMPKEELDNIAEQVGITKTENTIMQNTAINKLRPISMVLQGQIAQYHIYDRIEIKFNNGELAKEHLHILTEELEEIKRLLEK